MKILKCLFREKEIKVWLSDIKQAISEIDQFLPDKKIFQEFQKDLKSRRAIERNIEIIGEAVNRILSQNPDVQITSSRQIIVNQKHFNFK